MELNIQLINESVTTYLSSMMVNSPNFSVKELKEKLTTMIGQEPAIEIKRAPAPINELVTKSGAKTIQMKDRIEEISIFYIDLENKKPVKLRVIF